MDDSIYPGEKIDHYIKRVNRLPKRRKIRKQRLQKMAFETAIDEVNLFTPDSGQVILGVYGIEDWIQANILKDRYTTGTNVVQRAGAWLTNADFDLATWTEEQFVKYLFFGSNSVVCYDEDGTITKVVYGRGKIEVEVFGTADQVKNQINWFNTYFRKAENLIEWIYSARGDSISVPLNYRPAIREAYPWIDSSYTDLTDYIDEYIDSEASVLILIGPPGTGKTTFIKNLIHRSKADAKVAYDPKVMMDDSFFAGFIGDESRFLIMEDADEFLQSREEGNTMMHKFLNVSDGLISAQDKKLVFSTNLNNVSDIDAALMRPGRCFDVLQFRALTRDEAARVNTSIGSDRALPDGNQITLAELFSTLPSGKGYSRRKIGFTS